MLSYLAGLEDLWGPFRLFGSISLRMVLAGATAMIVGFLIAPRLMDRLKSLSMSQSFRDISEVGRLAELHSNKKFTPTMGGLMIYASIAISTLLWASWNVFTMTAIMVYTGLTGIGFVDDYLKVVKKNSKGLPGRFKLLGQALITIFALVLLKISKVTRIEIHEIWVPFYKFPLIDYLPLILLFGFFFLVLAGSSNAINLTDGIDGLAIGCSITAAFAYGLMSYASGNSVIADYLLLSYLPGSGELSILCATIVGASLTFLWYNSHPAEVFMGDTGSLGLGGLIGVIALMIHQPFTLMIVGGIFVIEAISVILQVASFKSRGKRIFKMAPIHHHFELLGWHENKVVIRFWILSLLFALIGLATLKLR